MKLQVPLFRITLNKHTDWGAAGEPDYNKLRAKYSNLSFISQDDIAPFDPEESSYKMVLKRSEFVVDKDGIIELVSARIKFDVVGEITTSVDISEQLQEWADKPIKISTDGGNTYNNRCEVHMPGMALGTYNQVLLEEDCCTDRLQEHLQEGWRIVAACPQPDQRRPDYILGRFNPTESNSF